MLLGSWDCKYLAIATPSQIVCVPGSSGASVFYRESLEDDVKINVELGIKALTEEGSPPTQEDEEFVGFRITRKGF